VQLHPPDAAGGLAAHPAVQHRAAEERGQGVAVELRLPHQGAVAEGSELALASVQRRSVLDVHDAMMAPSAHAGDAR
jgi:hypothetical protein